MDSDSSEEASSSTDQKAATSGKAPKMIDMIVDAVNNCADRKGASPAFIRNFIFRKYPDVNGTRFKTSFKKVFQTAIEKKILVRTKATEAAEGLSGRVKLATKAKPKKRAPAPLAQPASDRATEPGPSTKPGPKKTKSGEVVATEGRTKGAEASKLPGAQKKRAAQKKPAVADIESKNSTAGKKAASSGAATKGGKGTAVAAKGGKGTAVAAKGGKSTAVAAEAGKGTGVAAKAVKSTGVAAKAVKSTGVAAKAGKSSGAAAKAEKGNAVKMKTGKRKGVAPKRENGNASDDESMLVNEERFSESGTPVGEPQSEGESHVGEPQSESEGSIGEPQSEGVGSVGEPQSEGVGSVGEPQSAGEWSVVLPLSECSATVVFLQSEEEASVGVPQSEDENSDAEPRRDKVVSEDGGGLGERGDSTVEAMQGSDGENSEAELREESEESALDSEDADGESDEPSSTVRMLKRPGKKIASKKLTGLKKTAQSTSSQDDFSGTGEPDSSASPALRISNLSAPPQEGGPTGDSVEHDGETKAKKLRLKPARRAKN